MILNKVRKIFNPKPAPVSTPNPGIHESAKIDNSSISGNIKIGEKSWIYNALLSGGDISIGRYTSFMGPNSDIICAINPVVIGNFCSIARNVSIQEFNHKFERCTGYFILSHVFGEKHEDEISSKGPVIIENDVWIGTQSVILSGAKISNGCVVAANSVVNSEIPPFSIVAGNPAKVIKYRFPDEIIKMLLEIKWWDWPIEKIKKNKNLFQGELTIEKLNSIVND